MGAPICFLDTETTGLSLADDIWEFAAIRREPDGSESQFHLFLEHDAGKCAQLPESFRRDHEARFDKGAPPFVAARVIAQATDGAHIVGAVPNFDTERLAILLRRFGIRPDWHYHLIDVENLAVGWLLGSGSVPNPAGLSLGEIRQECTPPWKSDELSRAVGVEPPTDERHTAMGDAKWARALYDAITGAA